ncbi:hypothetical protein MJO28_006292 [Puccinia striiformis f. sp. tritici]|uniref:Uncharacterized protein n=1 Tax=Puccinia striiformis f. sp. tritici TaxID=168172 RepID=A0ACC0EHF4_9BASI|nr:hypothetical protein MJO28_006292 [Puccinia striiformis f. sp. tritici]
MSEHGADPSDTTALILKALGSLAKRYDEIDLDADSRELPLSPDPDVDYTNDRFGRLEALSLDELNALQELLIQMQTCLLPSLQQQITELLQSLDVADLENSPMPKVLDPLEIISRLGYTVENISAFLNAIGPIAVNLFQKPEEYDHAYGGLKKYRCRHLIEEINELETEETTRKLKILIGGIAKSTDASINDVIEYIKKSDLGILQDEWRRYANDLDATLTVLSRRADLTKQYEQEPDCSDEDQSDGASSSTDGDNQDTNDPSNPEKGVTKIPNDDREIRLDANFTGDHEADQSEATLSTDSSGDYSIRPQIIKLAQATIPLIKLIRIYFNKILRTPTGKPSFTIGTELSSADFTSIGHKTGSLSCETGNLLNLLFYIWDCDNEMDEREPKEVKEQCDRMCMHFDSCMKTMCSYMISSTLQVEPPISGNHFEAWSTILSEQFSLADAQFRKALHDFEIDIKM